MEHPSVDFFVYLHEFNWYFVLFLFIIHLQTSFLFLTTLSSPLGRPLSRFSNLPFSPRLLDPRERFSSASALCLALARCHLRTWTWSSILTTPPLPSSSNTTQPALARAAQSTPPPTTLLLLALLLLLLPRLLPRPLGCLSTSATLIPSPCLQQHATPLLSPPLPLPLPLPLLLLLLLLLPLPLAPAPARLRPPEPLIRTPPLTVTPRTLSLVLLRLQALALAIALSDALRCPPATLLTRPMPLKATATLALA